MKAYLTPLFVDLWPGWLAGVGISAVVFALLYLRNRQLAVSSCYAYLADRWSGRAANTPPGAPPLPTCGDTFQAASMRTANAQAVANPTPAWSAAFLIGILLGGGVAGLLARASGAVIPVFSFAYPGFDQILKLSPLAKADLLFAGGLLIGFGTRMAGGCTSGHAIMGAPALQKGSLIAMATFFGTGIVFTWTMRALVGG